MLIVEALYFCSSLKFPIINVQLSIHSIGMQNICIHLPKTEKKEVTRMQIGYIIKLLLNKLLIS